MPDVLDVLLLELDGVLLDDAPARHAALQEALRPASGDESVPEAESLAELLALHAVGPAAAAAYARGRAPAHRPRPARRTSWWDWQWIP